MNEAAISPKDPNPRKRVGVLGTEMAYVDVGAGDPIVFLHGNPTSSFLWRNVIPHLSDRARCLAPDLIGMGDSGKSSTGEYRFVDHAKHLDAWFDAVGLKQKVTLVVHDWGSAWDFIGRIGITMRSRESLIWKRIVRPLKFDDWAEQTAKLFKAMRSPAGDEMILQKNIFVERILPGSVLRKLTDEEMAVYRKPLPRAWRVAPSDADVAATDSLRRASLRTSRKSSMTTRSGSRRARFRNFSSMPTRARF